MPRNWRRSFVTRTSPFDVTILVNEPNHVVGRAIGDFYQNRRRDDLTFLYFTGHGVKDDDGRLYLAMTDTQRYSLRFTALSADLIDDAMEACYSRQKILVLDCCYSGAFPTGRVSKAGHEVDTLVRFQGKGRVVLTASDATQYSFEGNEISGQGTRSLFTRFLVEALATGKGDLDGDGDIAHDELYSYVHDRVIEEMPQQRPKKQENIEGRIVIARNIHWSLPVHVRNAMESPLVRDRLAALDDLSHLHRKGNDYVRAVVVDHVRRLVDDDIKVVSAAAIELTTTLTREKFQQEPEQQEPRNTEELDTAESPVPAPLTSSPAWLRRHRLRSLASSAALVIIVGAPLVVFAVLIAVLFDARTAPAVARIVSAVAVGDSPHDLVVAPDGRRVYVATDSDVSVIDTASNTVVATVSVGDFLREMVVTPDGRHIYVTTSPRDRPAGGEVLAIDTVSNSVTAIIPVGGHAAFGAGLMVAPDGRHVYVSNVESDELSVIDTVSNTAWSQAVGATLALSSNSSSLSAGVLNPSVLRGRLFSRVATSSSST